MWLHDITHLRKVFHNHNANVTSQNEKKADLLGEEVDRILPKPVVAVRSKNIEFQMDRLCFFPEQQFSP